MQSETARGFLHQVVGFVQHREQEVAGLGVAAHQHVGAARLDHFDGELHRAHVRVHGLEIERTVGQAQIVQDGLDLAEAADQHRLRETFILRGKDAP